MQRQFCVCLCLSYCLFLMELELLKVICDLLTTVDTADWMTVQGDLLSHKLLAPKCHQKLHIIYQQRCRSSVIFFWGGGDIFAQKYMYEKLTKCRNFTCYLPEYAQILHDNCPPPKKNIFSRILRVMCHPCPSVSCAYVAQKQHLIQIW